ncbi:MAG: hypothetical protein ACFFD5_07750 [Candidatus Thorarchaeota archaeon]
MQSQKKSLRKYFTIRIILLIIFCVALYFFYWVLIDLGSPPFVSILILIFCSLLFLGVLFRRKGTSFFSRFKHKKNQDSTSQYKEIKSNKPRIRRVDYVKLNSKYRKPIIRKCSNCGMELANFVKKCPNCGEKIVS